MKAALDIGVLSVIVLMMVTVGMELEGRQFRALARSKILLLLTMAAQTIILPILGFGLAHAMGLPPHISAGLMLVAACPIGDIANFYIMLARANLVFSVTLNSLTILLAPATMAIVFEVYHHLLGATFEFAVPTVSIFLRLILTLILPLLTGLAIRRVKPAFVASHDGTLRRIILIGIAYLLVTVILTQREQLMAEWQQTAAAAAAFIGFAFAVGMVLAWLLRLSQDDCLTIGIGFAVRNVAMATAIAFTLLERLEYGVFAVVYFLTEVPLLLAAAGIYRKWGTLSAQRAATTSPPL
jgi:bile acid:Na+ symporter, BASS family